MATPRINHNSPLTDVHRSLAIHNANTGRQITQLSSGLRINRYSDDPASLALADGISSEVRALAEGTRNIQQTFSLLQVADGSLNEIGDMVNRMRALAMQGATATLNDGNRLSLSSEFNSLREEIDRIASTTTYNGRRLLTGGNNTLSAESTALAAASATGLTDIHVTNAELGTYTFVDEPDDGLLTLGNGVHTQSVNIADFLNEKGIVPDRAFHKIRFERLGVEVTLTDDGVPGASGRYSDGVLDGQTLIVEQDAELALDLADRGYAPLKNLSGAEIARVDIAATLAADPDVVVIDDAFNGLDTKSTELVMSLLRAHAASGVPVILATDDWEAAEKFADDIVVLSQGKVTAAGSVDDLLGEHRYEVALADAEAAVARDLEEPLLHLYNHVKESGRHILLTAKQPPARWGIVLGDLVSLIPMAALVAVMWIGRDTFGPDELEDAKRTAREFGCSPADPGLIAAARVVERDLEPAERVVAGVGASDDVEVADRDPLAVLAQGVDTNSRARLLVDVLRDADITVRFAAESIE